MQIASDENVQENFEINLIPYDTFGKSSDKRQRRIKKGARSICTTTKGALRKERVELAERVWSEDKDIENEEQQPPCISELSRAEYLSDSS